MPSCIITQRQHIASVDASHLDELRPVLERRSRRFLLGGSRGYRREQEIVRHYFLLLNGLLCFSAGLIPRVRDHLERRGWVVDHEDLTYWDHLREADPTMLAGDLTIGEQGLAEAIAQNPFGQLLVKRQADVTDALVLFGRLFPGHNIWGVARNRQRVQELLSQVADRLERPVTSNPRDVWAHHPRMFLSTSQFFHHAASDGFHIAVFTDVESALATRTADIGRDWPDGTRYAVFNRTQRLHAYDEFQLEEIFGPVLDTKRGVISRFKVQIQFMGVERCVSGRQGDALSRKRNAYWQNDGWNQAVASVARHLCKRRNRENTLSEMQPNGPSRVVVLVETAEHGRQLRKLQNQRHIIQPPSATFSNRCLQSNVAAQFPDRFFVFLMHQGYTFLYFPVGESGDPPVYCYLEGDPEPKRVSSRSATGLPGLARLAANNMWPLSSGILAESTSCWPLATPYASRLPSN